VDRRRAAAIRASHLDRRRAAEADQARELIAGFIAEARARGLPPIPLTALSYRGGTRYRTGLSGWYLQADRAVAVGEDGNFYLLTVPGGWAARLRGARPEPAEPPLVVNEGGRDGESMPLAELLRRRLAAGPAWP
jgi:hypothetical protein